MSTATGRHEVRPERGPAIRCRCVSTVLGFDAPAMFPSNGVMTWRPLFSTGSLGMVPPLQRYCGTLRLPAVLLDPFDIFTSQYDRFARGFAPLGRGRPTRGPGSCRFRSPHPEFRWRRRGTLRFPGNPDGHRPCSSTPAGSGSAESDQDVELPRGQGESPSGPSSRASMRSRTSISTTRTMLVLLAGESRSRRTL